MVEIKKENSEVAEAKVFPVYQFIVYYKEKGKQKEIVYAENMVKQEIAEEEANAEMSAWMDAFVMEYPEIGKIFTHMELKEVKRVEWYPDYFCHETFRMFKDNAETFASFRAFVKEKIEECKRLGTDTECLMGAANEALWKICTCGNCRELGKTVIFHSEHYK